MKKLAVLFPGIGYTCHKPLLYYGAKAAQEAGYEIIRLEYSGFPSGVKGNKDKMALCFRMALDQTRAELKNICWSDYEDIVFISKSIGTAVASAFAKEIQINVRQVLFTPVEETFNYASGSAIVFHGTSDPWADTAVITDMCHKREIPLYLTPGANHSLETGDLRADMKELCNVIGIVREYIGEKVK